MNLKLLEDTKPENCAPRNNEPEERSSHPLRSGSLKLVEQKYVAI